MAKVLIGCKLPNGLVMEIVTPQKQLGALHPAPRGKFVKLNGSASVNGGRISRINQAPEYGTTLVEAEFAAAWFKANADLPVVQTGTVFVADNERDFASKVREGLAESSGFEPIDPAGDARTPPEVTADPDQLKRLGAAQTAAALNRQQ